MMLCFHFLLLSVSLANGLKSDIERSFVDCATTKGPFTIALHPEWAPIGVKRFVDMVEDGVLDGTAVYRTVKDQAIQFGIPATKEKREKWGVMPTLQDDPQDGPHVPKNPNFRRGFISFAGSGPNTRKLDLFITFLTGNDNGDPRAPWEVPLGEVESGIDNVMSFTTEYGDMPMFGGNGPDLGRMWNEGYDFLNTDYPHMEYFNKCTVRRGSSSGKY